MPQPIEITDDDPIRKPGRESRLVRFSRNGWLGRVLWFRTDRHWVYQPSVTCLAHSARELRAIADFLDQQNAALKLERRAKRKPVRRRMSAQRIRRSPKPKRKR